MTKEIHRKLAVFRTTYMAGFNWQVRDGRKGDLPTSVANCASITIQINCHTGRAILFASGAALSEEVIQ